MAIQIQNNWLHGWRTRRGQMLTSAVCIAWLPFLIPKRGTQGVNGQASQYRWTSSVRLNISQPHQRQNKGNACRICFPNNLNCSNKSMQAANCKLQSDPHILPKHLQHSGQLSMRPKMAKVKRTGKFWTIRSRMFQHYVDRRQKCHNSSDIRGLRKKTSLHLHIRPKGLLKNPLGH